MERRARAALELQRRKRDGGIRYFEPQDQQLPVLKCEERGCLVLGGNRAGKTVVGGAETAYRLTGQHPFKPVHKPPIKAWVCSQDLPGRVKAKGDEEQETHKQLEELRRWVPKDALRGGSWESAFSPGELTLSLKNGSLAVFKGYDQGPLKFESDAIHWCWFDEEPDSKQVYTSVQLRLADYDGQWMMTATPILSLLGKGWIEDLYEKRGKEGCGYEVHQLFSYDNPHLVSDVLDQLFGNLTEEEKQVRAFGMFARLGGRVLSDFDPSRHLVDDYVPPAAHRHFILIDPGWKTTAVLFAAVDPEGVVTLYAEHYQGEWLPEDHFAVVAAYREFFCEAAGAEIDFDILMDPAGFSIKRTTTGAENPSDADEWRKAARNAGAKWFSLRPAKNSDKMAWRPKRYFANDRMLVCRGLEFWRWEQERWTRQREREGIAAREKPLPEEPVDRDNHLMDLTRYLCNELPEAEAQPKGVKIITPETIVADHLERKIKAAERRRKGWR